MTTRRTAGPTPMQGDVTLKRDASCPVCGEALDIARRQTFELLTSRGSRAWIRCRRCRSYCDTTSYDTADEVTHTRSRPWGQPDSGVKLNESKASMFLSVLRLLERHRAGPRLVDVGCSYGGFMQLAHSHGYDVSGVDIVPEAVEYVRQRGLQCQVASTVADLSIADGSVDVVSALDCNYYWPSQITELGAIRAKLRPQGLLVMRVVDKSWLLAIGLAARRRWRSFGNRLCERAVNDHRVSIPVRALLATLRRAGFDVLSASPRGAVHGRASSLPVRVMFASGYLVWQATGQFMAPGCLILARKTPA
jgi:SAM-dependent methyltransferase